MSDASTPPDAGRRARRRRRRPGICLAVLALAGMAHAPAKGEEPPILRSKHGAPIKLIVREPSAIYEDPDPKSNSRPAAPFDFYYALEPSSAGRAASARSTRNGYYSVAQSPQGGAIGWLPAERVVAWAHRQALGFAPRGRRRPALFYADAVDLIEAQAGRVGPEARAISQEPQRPPVPGARPVLLPILEERDVEVQGDTLKIYKVAYLHRPEGEAPPPPPVVTLDIAFVMDATGSMQDWISETIKAVGTLSREIATIPSLKGKVRFALVCFRDSRLDYRPDRPGVKGHYVPPDDFIVRTYCDLDEGADHKIFLQQFDRVFAEGGGNSPERVLDGLKEAITKLAWRKGSYKHIILVGNASTHVDPAKSGGLTIEQVLREAQPPDARDDPSRAITVHAIQVPGPDAADSLACGDQFRRFAKGVSYPGLFDEQTHLGDFSRKLLDLLRGRLNPIRALARGDSRDDVIRAARDDRMIGPLLAMLRTADGSTTAGFTTGYVAENDAEGRRQVEPYLLVRRDQLERFGAFLDSFALAVEQASNHGGRDLGQIVESLQRNLGFLNLGETVDRVTPTKEILKWVLDAPVRDPAFDITPQILAGYDDESFRRWKAKVAASRAMVQDRLDDQPAWVDLGRERRADRKHSFVRIVDLP